MEDLKAYFDSQNEPKYLSKAKAKSEVKKDILATIVSQYIGRDYCLISNMNKIYGIIWVKCTPGIQSGLTGNEDLLYK